MKKVIMSVFVSMFLAGVAFAASMGSVTHTIDDKYKTPNGVQMIRHKFTMVSTTNGQAFDTSAGVTFSGPIRLIYVDHDGTVTDNFDIYLVDGDNKDWLQGEGVNFDSTNSDNDNQRYPIMANSGAPIYMPNIEVYTSGTGFGSAKTVYFYILEE